MLMMKSINDESEVFMMGTLEDLTVELMMGNRAFYRALKEKNEITAEVFKIFMIENVEMIFEESDDSEKTAKSQQDRLNEVLDEAQKLINRLRAKK